MKQAARLVDIRLRAMIDQSDGHWLRDYADLHAAILNGRCLSFGSNARLVRESRALETDQPQCCPSGIPRRTDRGLKRRATVPQRAGQGAALRGLDLRAAQGEGVALAPSPRAPRASYPAAPRAAWAQAAPSRPRAPRGADAGGGERNMRGTRDPPIRALRLGYGPCDSEKSPRLETGRPVPPRPRRPPTSTPGRSRGRQPPAGAGPGAAGPSHRGAAWGLPAA